MLFKEMVEFIKNNLKFTKNIANEKKALSIYFLPIDGMEI